MRMGPASRPTVVITGAANGLGKALAKACRDNGSALALIDVDGDGLRALKDGFAADGPMVTVHQADVAEEEQLAAACRSILQAHGHIDWLIANAGISISRPFEDVDPADMRRLFEVNYWGCVHAVRQFLPALKASPDARVVTVASLFGALGFPGKTAYGSSKAAILGFSSALRTELRGTRVKVCTVIPPPLDTGLVRNGLHRSVEKRAQEVAYLQANGMDLDHAARIIVGAVRKARPRVIVGWRMLVLDLSLRLFPSVVQRMVERRAARLPFV